MMTKKYITFGLVMIFTALSFGELKADVVLIKELEQLTRSLTPRDKAKMKLSIRLGDLYFEQITKEQNVVKNTKKAIKAYSNVLTGFKGKFKAPQGQQKALIQFQLARLYNRGTDQKKAVDFFTKVFKDQYSPLKVKKEASLSLAEYYSNKGNFKQSQHFYNESLKLCNSGDSCAYTRYQLSWLLYREGKVNEAVTEIRKTLFDSKGQSNEQSLRDFKLFVSNKVTDGVSELEEFQNLTQQTGNPELIKEMSDAFYAAGNRKAGTYFLEQVFNKTPKFFYRLRLIEESIGFRDMERVEELAEDLSLKDAKIPSDKEEAKKTKEIVKRIIVQLDSLRKENAGYKPALRTSIDLYLGLYPKDELREKMIEGYLDVIDSREEKAELVSKWANEERTLGLEKLELKHRKSLLGHYQKLKNSEKVIETALTLSKMVKGDDQRKYRYIAAREMYEKKENDKAAPIFKELAIAATIDKWAVQSLNLFLDILNQKKDVDVIVSEIAPFLERQADFEKAGFKKDFSELKKIQTQAKFESAVNLGQTEKALETFMGYCKDGTFGQKACDNAKVLAVQLSNQAALITLLEKAKDEKALMNEYELMGRFSDAAKLREKYKLKVKRAPIQEYIKIALLYEMDGDTKARDRILKKLWNKVSKLKKLDPKLEPLLYLTFFEAGMLNDAKALKIAWSPERKLRIVQQLDYFDKGNKRTKKIIASSKDQLGYTWSKIAIAAVLKADAKQRKRGFYGRRSKRNFKRRIKFITALKTTAEKYLQGGNYPTRVIIANVVSKSYKDLESEILKTPLPEGLTPEIKTQVEAQLNQMASPFTQLASDYEKLATEQKAKIEDQEQIAYLDSVLAEPTTDLAKVDYKKFIKVTPLSPEKTVESLNLALTQPMMTKLESNPYDNQALGELQAFYETNGFKRQAAYFKERTASEKQEEK
ncbi:MAG: tetratricopeptide repeat protein [Bacteriovoracaceae bacterium]